MKSGHLLLLFINPEEPEIFVRWQIAELVLKRVLGFSYDNSDLTITRSKFRKKESIANSLELKIDEELGSNNFNYFDFLKKFRRIHINEILESSGTDYYKKRVFSDKIKNNRPLTELAEKSRAVLTSELRSWAALSRKRNPKMAELYKKAKVIHQNIFELSIVLWNNMDCKTYKSILSNLNIRFIQDTMNLTESESAAIYSVLDYMVFGTPRQDQRGLGLRLTEFPGPFDQGYA